MEQVCIYLKALIRCKKDEIDYMHWSINSKTIVCSLMVLLKDWIRMHDLVHEVAISIASRDLHVFTMRNDTQIEWPGEDMLKNCPAIFLHDCKPWKVPEGLEYPQLEFFCMNPKDPFIKIPNHFFSGMSNLKGLALSNMQFLSSFHLLLNLQTLCLD